MKTCKIILSLLICLLLTACNNVDSNDYIEEDNSPAIIEDFMFKLEFNDEGYTITNYELNSYKIVIPAETEDIHVCNAWASMNIKRESHEYSYSNPCTSFNGNPYILIDDYMVHVYEFLMIYYVFDEQDLTALDYLGITVLAID